MESIMFPFLHKRAEFPDCLSNCQLLYKAYALLNQSVDQSCLDSYTGAVSCSARIGVLPRKA